MSGTAPLAPDVITHDTCLYLHSLALRDEATESGQEVETMIDGTAPRQLVTAEEVVSWAAGAGYNIGINTCCAVDRSL